MLHFNELTFCFGRLCEIDAFIMCKILLIRIIFLKFAAVHSRQGSYILSNHVWIVLYT